MIHVARATAALISGDIGVRVQVVFTVGRRCDRELLGVNQHHDRDGALRSHEPLLYVIDEFFVALVKPHLEYHAWE